MRSLAARPLLALLCFGVVLVAAVFASNLAWRWLGLPPQLQHHILQPWPNLLTACVIVAIGLGTTYLFVRGVEGRRLATIGLAVNPAGLRALAVGALFGTTTPLGVWLILSATHHATHTATRLTFGAIIGATVPMALAIAGISANEEICFRGYPLQMLVRRFNAPVGAVFTGIVFGLGHAGNPGANVLGVVQTAVNGILLAFIVIKTGGLLLACGYHAGWNLMAALVLGLRDSGISNGGALMYTDLTGPSWLTGGAFGFEGSILAGILEVIVLSIMLRLVTNLPGDELAQQWYRSRANGSRASWRSVGDAVA